MLAMACVEVAPPVRIGAAAPIPRHVRPIRSFPQGRTALVARRIRRLQMCRGDPKVSQVSVSWANAQV
jgi:hypothetical protein